jgi:hypothetical protein
LSEPRVHGSASENDTDDATAHVGTMTERLPRGNANACEARLLHTTAAVTSFPRYTAVVLLGLAACGGVGSVNLTTDPDADVAKDATPAVDASHTKNEPVSTDAGDAANSGADAASPLVAPADASVAHEPSHDCTPACGSGKLCQYPERDCAPFGGGEDAGSCPPPPPAACEPFPAACVPSPTCACLISAQCGAEGFGGTCYIDADGDWVIGCTQG